MEQTSKFKHYLKMALSGAGMFLLLFLAMMLFMFVLDKAGLDRDVIRLVALVPVFLAIYWIGTLRALLGVVLIAIIVAIPVSLLYFTSLGDGFFKLFSQVGQ